MKPKASYYLLLIFLAATIIALSGAMAGNVAFADRGSGPRGGDSGSRGPANERVGPRDNGGQRVDRPARIDTPREVRGDRGPDTVRPSRPGPSQSDRTPKTSGGDAIARPGNDSRPSDRVPKTGGGDAIARPGSDSRPVDHTPGTIQPGRPIRQPSDGRPKTNQGEVTPTPGINNRPTDRDPGTIQRRPDSGSHDNGSQTPGGNVNKIPGSDDRRPDRNPGTIRPGRDTKTNDRDSNARRTGFGSTQWTFTRNYSRVDLGHGRDLKSYRPKGWTAPVLRSGYYRYQDRPHYKPMRYGYWAFDNHDSLFCRRSVYFHFGYFPYVQVARVWVTPYVVVEYVSAPVVLDGGYYLSKSAEVSLSDALADIRRGWIDSRLDLIQNHVSTDQKIAVLLDGNYDYSLDSTDYLDMTADAVDEMQTVSFTWNTVKQRADGAYTAFGKHVFQDSSGSEQTVYVSYTVGLVGSDYMILEVGSSTSPLN